MENQKTPDIGGFTKIAPETQAAFRKFMGTANPFEVKEVSKDDPVGPVADPAAPADPADPTEETLEKAIRQMNESPEKTYQDRLREHKITEDDARKIVDVIMTKGVYQRTYPVTSKTTVTFRSRVLSDQERAQEVLEEQQPQFMGTVNMILAKNNLAASLVQLGDAKFGPDDSEKALKFVSKLPHMLFNVLIAKLAAFDELVLTVMDEGAIENF